MDDSWTDQYFQAASRACRKHQPRIDSRNGDLAELKATLLSNRHFLLHLLENSNLLEHDTFTELMWSVFHMTEELALRKDLTTLSAADRDHFSTDINRFYGLLAAEWLVYMQHLKSVNLKVEHAHAQKVRPVLQGVL